MSKKPIEKIPVKRFEDSEEADVNPRDIDLDKAHSCLAGEFKELAEHHLKMGDSVGADLLDNIKHTVIAIVMAYPAKITELYKTAQEEVG